jgi:hypothetical protein
MNGVINLWLAHGLNLGVRLRYPSETALCTLNTFPTTRVCEVQGRALVQTVTRF